MIDCQIFNMYRQTHMQQNITDMMQSALSSPQIRVIEKSFCRGH